MSRWVLFDMFTRASFLVSFAAALTPICSRPPTLQTHLHSHQSNRRQKRRCRCSKWQSGRRYGGYFANRQQYAIIRPKVLQFKCLEVPNRPLCPPFHHVPNDGPPHEAKFYSVKLWWVIMRLLEWVSAPLCLSTDILAECSRTCFILPLIACWLLAHYS